MGPNPWLHMPQYFYSLLFFIVVFHSKAISPPSFRSLIFSLSFMTSRPVFIPGRIRWEKKKKKGWNTKSYRKCLIGIVRVLLLSWYGLLVIYIARWKGRLFMPKKINQIMDFDHIFILYGYIIIDCKIYIYILMISALPICFPNNNKYNFTLFAI